ncbi:hypothetical protein Esi_0250_0035 [Ectocarpus siliculosus]|uniref:Uncharacterized protein n=1 Tax=Ectocarpus siliculosus TaxID=2880 RepID=D8LJE3_ECTSI|nr:hypothetical protein Esi_0250_0035 [Ectocarpus siliculosus]|eukprot:CBN79476.1 hypothetical protein Esi_0250_0035 [Ectocarpus siliculosus]
MKKTRKRPDQGRSGTATSSEKDRNTPNLEEAPVRRYLRLGTQATRTTRAAPRAVFTPRRRDTGAVETLLAHSRSQTRPPPLRGSATTWVVPCARWTAETSRRQKHPQPGGGAGPAVPTARHAGHPDNQGGSAGGVHPEATRHRGGGDAAGALSLPDATAAPSGLGDNMGRPVREVDGRDIQAIAGAPSRAGNSGPLRNARLLPPSPAPSPPPPAPAALPPAPAGEPNILQPPDPAPQRQAPFPPPAVPEARYSLSSDDLLGAVDDDDEPHAQAVPWAGVIGAPLMPAGPAPSRFDLSEVGPLNFAESPVESYGGHQEGGNGGEEGVPAEAAEGDSHEQQGGNDGEAAAPDAAPVPPVEPARRIGSRMRRPSRRLVESLAQA